MTTAYVYVFLIVININTPFWDDSDHIQDRSRLRSPKQVAETIINEYKRQAEIIVE
ncbi:MULTISPECIES: hypothetical protein [Anoxybacillus]|uniref:Short-chain dehydrogenase/reductase SDR n=1 Tax=Anoxybacillus flavithermus TaxID=33934 RepID=A0A178T4F0_9BACL|nr:hypothetical protein [Anoxybacillus flavithermus]OAO76366.1 Short-chain dehydrogenase/reductase SDR [Anoxybacillus flavithermus]